MEAFFVPEIFRIETDQILKSSNRILINKHFLGKNPDLRSS